MVKTVDEYVKMFRGMCQGDNSYELHIQVGEIVIHLHSNDTGFDVLYNLLKDLQVTLIRFSDFDDRFDLCFKH